MMNGKYRRMIEISTVVKILKIVLTVVLLIFSTSIACAGVNNAAANETMIESFIQDLADQNVSVKVNAVKALVEIGESAVEPLIQALENDNPKIRENAAHTLGKIGDERAVGPLVKIMNDPNEILPPRENAIFALGEIGRLAVEPLIQAMENESPQIRARAAEALGKIGDERAIIPLNRASHDKYGMVRDAARIGVRGFEGHDKYKAIAIYGKERNFSTEDERKEWLDKLDTIGSGVRDHMLPYHCPDGPIISYGYNDNGYISVEFSEGDGVSEAYMDEIYDIFNWQAMQMGISDIPVVFKKAVTDATDVCGEFYDVPQNTPGFTAITLLMAFLGAFIRKQK
jgi:hypothetical protein